MKRIFASLLILACLTNVAFAALPAGMVYEIRTTGAQVNAGGFNWTSLRNSTYRWTLSAHGTNEYYCQTAAGGDPSITASGSVTCDGSFNLSAAGSVGSLTAGQCAYADNDTLGYTTPYVRLADGTDPDTKTWGWVSYGAGGTDYSQQANAQVSATDLRITRGDTTQVYRTGATKWAADYVNNSIHITAGSGFTQNWYHIVSVDPNNDAHLDKAAGTAGSTAGTGTLGGAFLIGGSLDDDFIELTVAGNSFFMAGGSYTLGEAWGTAKAGSGTAPCSFLGYATTRGDTPKLTNRPLWNNAAYGFTMTAAGWIVGNLRMTGTAASVASVGSTSMACIFNIEATNTSTSAAKNAFTVSGPLIGCQGSTAGSGTSAAFNNVAASSFLKSCYAHDSPIGVAVTAFAFLSNCGIKSCTTGVACTTASPPSVVMDGCTIYGCTNAFTVDGVTYPAYAINCIFTGNGTGVYAPGGGTPRTTPLLMFCQFYNTTDVSDAWILFGNRFADPQLVNPAAGDFSITSGSDAYGRGLDVGTYTDLITYPE